MDMSERPPHSGKPPASPPGRGYEERDASFGALVKWGVGLVVAMGAVLAAMRALFGHLAPPMDEFPVPSQLADTRAPYVGPKLQVHAPQDLKEWRAAEDAVLNGWAWVDPEKGVVRMPVARAIELLAARGLPPRTGTGGTKQ